MPCRRPSPVLKTTLDSEEIKEIVDRLQSLEQLLAKINVSVLIDNEAIADDVVDDVIFSKVRVIQCLKLLGARAVPTKQNVRKQF